MALIRKEGHRFTFNSDACRFCKGRCCTGSSGYIWISDSETAALAEHLQLTVSELRERYLIRVGARTSIKEVELSENNFACQFFDQEQNQCSIYEHRPEQCRTFPFWPEFQRRPKEAAEECPGVFLDS